MTTGIELIVIGGSAGSLQPLLNIVGTLKSTYEIPILLVMHRNTSHSSALEELLSMRTQLVAREIEEKDRIVGGSIFICPPDYHILIEKDHTFSLDDSEKVNFSRPSIDVVFKSASEIYRDKLVCILLSGANADGAAGLVMARKNGSKTIVQDPEEAEAPYMPKEAIKMLPPDHILTSNEISGYINSLVF